MLDIAMAAGFSQARIGRFEAGEPVRDIDHIVYTYARELGTTPKELWRDAVERD